MAFLTAADPMKLSMTILIYAIRITHQRVLVALSEGMGGGESTKVKGSGNDITTQDRRHANDGSHLC